MRKQSIFLGWKKGLTWNYDELMPFSSGNSMGDLGARMLSKALQINNKLKTIMWDRNNTTAQGFEDIADALEK